MNRKWRVCHRETFQPFWSIKRQPQTCLNVLLNDFCLLDVLDGMPWPCNRSPTGWLPGYYAFRIINPYRYIILMIEIGTRQRRRKSCEQHRPVRPATYSEGVQPGFIQVMWIMIWCCIFSQYDCSIDQTLTHGFTIELQTALNSLKSNWNLETFWEFNSNMYSKGWEKLHWDRLLLIEKKVDSKNTKYI